MPIKAVCVLVGESVKGTVYFQQAVGIILENISVPYCKHLHE